MLGCPFRAYSFLGAVFPWRCHGLEEKCPYGALGMAEVRAGFLKNPERLTCWNPGDKHPENSKRWHYTVQDDDRCSREKVSHPMSVARNPWGSREKSVGLSGGRPQWGRPLRSAGMTLSSFANSAASRPRISSSRLGSCAARSVCSYGSAAMLKSCGLPLAIAISFQSP